MKNHHRDFAHLRVVQPSEQPKPDLGTALIFGPFPPLTSPSSEHASATLHLLKSAGFQVVSATGPGLALAGHQLNFTSAGRFDSSAGFLKTPTPMKLAVVYTRSAEFARIAKPKWYQRRLEELRRVKFMMRLIETAEQTCLVLENHPLCARDTFSFWAISHIWSRVRGKKLSVVNKTLRANELLTGLTGLREPAPSQFAAEASAYETAFDAMGDKGTVRLTCTRSAQCAQSWAAKTEAGRANKVLADLDELIAIFRRHDLRAMPQFRLMWRSPAHGSAGPGFGQSDAVKFACEPDPAYARFKLPITRYMIHLRSALGKEKDFPLTTKAEARAFLNWALWEAGANTPEKRLPISQEISDFVAKASKSFGPILLPSDDQVTHAAARDAAPFSLSPQLVGLWKSDVRLTERYDINNPVDRVGFTLETLLRLPKDQDPRTVLGSAACNWLTHPIGGNGLCVTRLEFLLALMARFELSGPAAAERPWEEDGIRNWVRSTAFDVFPALRRLSPGSARRVPLRHDLSIAGLPKSHTGVGSNLRMSFDAFRKIGVSPKVYDVANHMAPTDLAPAQVFGRRLAKSVNLHHMNADSIPQVLVSSAIARSGPAHNIGFLLWEFDVLPKTHRLALDMLDEIWVPSEFLRQTYAAATHKPVHNVKKGIRIPRIAAVDLKDMGINGQAFTFLTCFDFHSSVARKNPMAAVRAFQDAFPVDRGDDVRLIIKTTPIQARHWGDPERQMAQIEAAMAADPRMTLIAEHLPFNRLLGLIAACDCLLSPHRAEGFGLMPAYALGLGKPVMSTDYSGTTDFCTAETATPLPYALSSVAASQVLHPMDGARWANVDHEAFVAALSDIYANPGPALKRALSGAKLIKTQYSPNNQAQRYKARLSELGAFG